VSPMPSQHLNFARVASQSLTLRLLLLSKPLDKALALSIIFSAEASSLFVAHKHLFIISLLGRNTVFAARVSLASHGCVVPNKTGPCLLTGVPRSSFNRNKEQFGNLATRLQAAGQFANQQPSR